MSRNGGPENKCKDKRIFQIRKSIKRLLKASVKLKGQGVIGFSGGGLGIEMIKQLLKNRQHFIEFFVSNIHNVPTGIEKLNENLLDDEVHFNFLPNLFL